VAINLDNYVSRAFIRAAEDNGLPVASRAPTFHTTTSHNALDLVLLSDPRLLSHHEQVSVPGISRHDLVSCSLTISSPREVRRSVTCRSYRNVDQAVLLADPILSSLGEISPGADVDQAAEAVGRVILQAMDKFAPLSTKVFRRLPAPWTTSVDQCAPGTRPIRILHVINPQEPGPSTVTFTMSRSSSSAMQSGGIFEKRSRGPPLASGGPSGGRVGELLLGMFPCPQTPS
jgi:hypothetical protein